MNKYAWCLLAVVAAGAVATQGYAQTATTAATNTAPAANTNAAATNAAATAAPTSANAAATPNTTAATAAPAAKPVAKLPEDAKGKPVVAADNKENFDAIAAAIRQQMQPGGRFAFVTPDGRAKVNAGLDELAKIFSEYGTVDKMSPTALARVNYDQNSINEVLARYDSNRRICHNETPVGSHIPKRVCKTLGEIQQEQNNSQQMMHRIRNNGSSNLGLGPTSH